MKINVPDPETTDLDNQRQNDSFGYFSVASSLTRLITGSNSHLVIGISNKWGEGKTTFLKLWEMDLEQNSIPYKYINAFEFEVTEDPFFPLCGQLSELIPIDKQDEFKEKAKSIAIHSLKFAGAAAIKIVSGGISAGGILETSGVESDIANKGAELVESGIDKASSLLQNNQEFKDSLATNLTTTYPDKPVVIIIDELDRCRPDFTLKFLERIKHLFCIDNLVFVIAVLSLIHI